MKWINSLGGPFLLVAATHLPCWRGNDGDGADYKRTSTWGKSIISLKVGSGVALAIHESNLIGWLPARGVFASWGGADSYRHVEAALRRVPDTIFKREPLRFRAATRRHYLFDSVYSGATIREGEWTRINLEIGEYDVLSADYRPDDRTHLYLHQLVRRLDPR